MTEGTKYHPLFEHLLFSGLDRLQLSFSEIEMVLDARLPPSARIREEWWSNSPNGHSQARAWMRANYRVSANLERETATFIQNSWSEAQNQNQKTGTTNKVELGLAESSQSEYSHLPADEPKETSTKHPLFGIWKGKVTLLQDHDYTKPMFVGGDC